MQKQGQLLTRFYGTSHASTGNYIAMISGQGPNSSTHADCANFAPWQPFDADGNVVMAEYAQAARAGNAGGELHTAADLGDRDRRDQPLGRNRAVRRAAQSVSLLRGDHRRRRHARGAPALRRETTRTVRSAGTPSGSRTSTADATAVAMGPSSPARRFGLWSRASTRIEEFGAHGTEWRTPPLWGLHLSRAVAGPEAGFLHDGRARTLEEAILWHGGEAEGARSRFRDLPPAERAALVWFLKSL